MSTIDQQFIEFIVKTLVNNPDKVNVEREIDERGVLLSFTVDPEDVGRVIGKRGATAQSIRTLLRVLGTKNGARYNLKIINTDEPATEHTAPAESSVEEPVSEPAPEELAETDTEIDTATDELAEKTRAELADLDDLDI